MLYTTYELKTIQLKLYPESIMLTRDCLVEMHEGDPQTQRLIMQCVEDYPSVFYCLPPKMYGAMPGLCCNGIRYGDDGDYMSLPQIPERAPGLTERLEKIQEGKCPYCYSTDIASDDGILDEQETITCDNCRKVWTLSYSISLDNVEEA